METGTNSGGEGIKEWRYCITNSNNNKRKKKKVIGSLLH